MQKFYLFLTFFFTLFSLAHAMDILQINDAQEKTTLLPNTFSVNQILHVDDPVKFEALVKIVVDKHNFEIQEKSELPEGISHKEKKLTSLKESISTLHSMNLYILTKLEKVTQQAINPFNRESLKGLGKTFMWAAATGILLGTETYLYLSNLNPDLKIVAGLPITVGIFGSFVRFFDHADKTIGNTHINEKIENYLEKIMFLRKTKKNILQDITSLTKEIEQQKKTLPSSEFEEINIHE